MLNISYEFRKGILFIRMSGELTTKTSFKLKKEITDMIEDNGITNVVFNISKIRYIDNYGIESLLKSFNACRKNNGCALLCYKPLKNNRLFEIFKNDIISNELNAFEKIIV